MKNDKAQDTKPTPIHHPLYETLHQLWQTYLTEAQWIPIDRWMAVHLRALPKLSQRQKLWLGRQLQDASRLAICVLFCERIFTHFEKERDGGLSDALPVLAAQTSELLSPGHSIKAALSAMKPTDFFFWLRLRRSGSGQTESGADPMPTPRHRSAKARRIWPDISRNCSNTPNLIVQLLWSGLPPGIEPFVTERMKLSNWEHDDLSVFLARHIQPSPTWLRINHLDQVTQLRQELLAKGFTIHSERGDAMQVSGSVGLYELNAHQNGLFEVQDLASQEIGRAMDVQPGLFLWDACAGTGGKSLQMAALLQSKGALYASDINEKKLETLRQRARRANLGNSLRTLPWQGEELPDFGKEISLRNGFDRVLVDAPCSGSGTLRRNPDGRLDFDPQRITKLSVLQLQLLSSAADAVRPGGLLVYASCSLLCLENEAVVSAFLERDKRFTLKSQKLFGNPEQDSDTTFAAVMIRDTAPAEPGS